MKIEPSPRPDDESRESWRALIRDSLPKGEQHSFEQHEFVPCFTCSSKPGAPSLCRGCLANRQTIFELRAKVPPQLHECRKTNVDAIWLRTDLVPVVDKRQGVDPADQPQVLRVLALVDGQWRVAIEYLIDATGQMISHISEGHALGNKPVDPLTTK